MKTAPWDLIVIGGGPAGVAAAVTAARMGAATCLVEQDDKLGGAGAAGLHPYLCGLYANNPDAPFSSLNPGLPEETADRLDVLAGRSGRQRIGRVEVHRMARDAFSRVLSEMAAEQSRLQVRHKTRLMAVDTTDNRVSGIRLQGTDPAELPVELPVERIIDATGDGQVLQACGDGCDPHPDERQLAGYCFRINGIDNRHGMAALRVPYCLRRAVEHGEFPAEFKYSTLTLDAGDAEGVCKLSVAPDAAKDPDFPAQAWAVRVHARLCLDAPEFAQSTLGELSPRVLARSGVTLRGRYRMTAADIRQARHAGDGCVRGAWPIEFWDPVNGPVWRYIEPGRWYAVPARCLQSDRIANLYAAGRCIAADGPAISALRVMGTCLALGEAAARIALSTPPETTE